MPTLALTVDIEFSLQRPGTTAAALEADLRALVTQAAAFVQARDADAVLTLPALTVTALGGNRYGVVAQLVLRLTAPLGNTALRARFVGPRKEFASRMKVGSASWVVTRCVTSQRVLV